MEASYALTAFAVGIIVSYLVAEFIGRQKHIGGWWSFFVVLSSLPFLFIPGLIAVFASPSAKREPTEDSDWILFPGVLILVASFFCFLFFIDLKIAHSRISLTWLSWAISTLVLGSYITILGWGKIKNVRPKFRENVLGAWISSKIKMAGKSTKLNFRNPSIINETLYYIIEDGMPVGPFALQQVKDKQLKAGTLVCRNGEQKWSVVEEMNELYPYVIFPPPPIDEPPSPPKPSE